MPGGSTRTGWTRWDSSWPSSLAPEAERSVKTYFLERFGVEEPALAGFCLVKKGSTVYALSAPKADPEPSAGLKVVSVGLPLARIVGNYWKPTSVSLRLLDPWITSNRLSLEPEEALKLLREGQLKLHHHLEEGYVLLESSGLVLGCGLALPGRIKSQIPRRETRTLFGKSQGSLWDSPDYRQGS